MKAFSTGQVSLSPIELLYDRVNAAVAVGTSSGAGANLLRVAVFLHAINLRSEAHRAGAVSDAQIEAITTRDVQRAVKFAFAERRALRARRFGCDTGGGCDRGDEHCGGAQ